MGDCLVTNAVDAPFTRYNDGEAAHADGEVLLALNCNRGAATATTPGSSLASSAGRDFQAKAEEAAARPRRTSRTNWQRPARPPVTPSLRSRPVS